MTHDQLATAYLISLAILLGGLALVVHGLLEGDPTAIGLGLIVAAVKTS